MNIPILGAGKLSVTITDYLDMLLNLHHLEKSKRHGDPGWHLSPHKEHELFPRVLPE